MFEKDVTADLQHQVGALLAKTPSIMPSNLAKECGVAEAVAVAALPKEMRSFTDRSQFDNIWAQMREWSLVTFIVASSGAIVEFKGQLPRGVHAHGFFNLMEKGHPLGGHLPVTKLGSICFLEKEFFGLRSQSVQFYDQSGNAMFSVYVGREKKVLIPEIVERFEALKKACEKE